MNKRTIIYLVCLAFLKTAWCGVTVRIAEPNTLLPYPSQEVILGSPVALVIHSDANTPWKGGLFIRGQERALALLKGVGDIVNERKYPGSCLTGAGDFARAFRWNDSNIWGFDLYTDDVNTLPGDWFVVKYLPLEIGDCRVEFYEYSDANDFNEPRSSLLLENTPSRDFTGNGVVNLEDYVRFAAAWTEDNCSEPDWCGQADLNRDGTVALADLLMFSEHWLRGTLGWKPASPPTPSGPVDPNVIYGITDGQGLAEINLPVGESITLYMNKTTLEQDVYLFHLEADISDPSLGWIDNTEYDPNNPPGPGTARILASPRMALFDYWGPGFTQLEGIQSRAVNPGTPINDGHLASFVYTAAAVGDVTLSLADYGMIPSTLHNILIHQTDLMESMSDSSDTGLETSSVSAETSAFNTEEAVEFLETVWEEEPEIRQTVTQEEWDTFIENVQEVTE